jgi:two-component system sensor histidine kinase/response regulator
MNFNFSGTWTSLDGYTRMTTKTPDDIANARILIVDDNSMSRKLIEFGLAREGYAPISASSGEEALEMLARLPADLMFLDLMMDGMSGMDVLAAVAANPALTNLSVVVVSGVEDTELADQCIAAGAVDFLSKPVRADVLRDITADLLAGRPPAAGGAEAADTGEDAGAAISALPLFEPARVAQMCEDYGNDTVAEFITRFERKAAGLRGAIVDGAGPDSRAAAVIAVHTLKGGARSFGLIRLAALARDIERAFEAGENATAEAQAAALDRHFDASLESLRNYAQDL